MRFWMVTIAGAVLWSGLQYGFAQTGFTPEVINQNLGRIYALHNAICQQALETDGIQFDFSDLETKLRNTLESFGLTDRTLEEEYTRISSAHKTSLRRDICEPLFNTLRAQLFEGDLFSVVQTYSLDEAPGLDLAKRYFKQEMDGDPKSVQVFVIRDDVIRAAVDSSSVLARIEAPVYSSNKFDVQISVKVIVNGVVHQEMLTITVYLSAMNHILEDLFHEVFGTANFVLIKEDIFLDMDEAERKNGIVVHELRHLLDVNRMPEMFDPGRVKREMESLRAQFRTLREGILGEEYKQVLESEDYQHFIMYLLNYHAQSTPRIPIDQVCNHLIQSYREEYENTAEPSYLYIHSTIESSAIKEEIRFLKIVGDYSLEKLLHEKQRDLRGLERDLWPADLTLEGGHVVQVYGAPKHPFQVRYWTELYHQVH